MGVSNVYIKYVAEFSARREFDRANALLSTGLAVTIPSCATVFACIALGWNWFAPWLHLPAAHAGDGKEAVLIVLGVFLSSIAFNAFGDMLTGTQQILSTQVFLTISLVVEFVMIIWLVSIGRGIRGLAEAYLIRVVINDGLTWWWAHRTIKWLRLSPRRVSRESLKYVVHFGGLVQLQSMLGIVQLSPRNGPPPCLPSPPRFSPRYYPPHRMSMRPPSDPSGSEICSSFISAHRDTPTYARQPSVPQWPFGHRQ